MIVIPSAVERHPLELQQVSPGFLDSLSNARNDGVLVVQQREKFGTRSRVLFENTKQT